MLVGSAGVVVARMLWMVVSGLVGVVTGLYLDFLLNFCVFRVVVWFNFGWLVLILGAGCRVVLLL